MIFIILSVLFSYRSASLAKQKGQVAALWVFISIAALFIGMLIGTAIIMTLFYRGQLDPVAFAKFLAANPLRELTVYVIACGGGLLINYILDRMPDKKEM